MNLTEKDKQKIIQCINDDKPVPAIYKQKLFGNHDVEYVESTKDYKLIYKGKARKEDIIANTPAAPLQKIRSFNADHSFEDDCSNMLVFGDNLFALQPLF
jgi:site-specific DNA-methyltransferase (adenine-specific)/adenine-specific DNA-methyltransferase